MDVLIGICASLGVLCIAAAGYRAGSRRADGRVQDLAELAQQWRDLATAQTNAKQDLAELARGVAQGDIAAWQRRADAMGRFLGNIGYRVQEIEDPSTGAVAYRIELVQPDCRGLPLGPTMN